MSSPAALSLLMRILLMTSSHSKAGISADVALPVEWTLQELRYLGYVVGVGKLADGAFADRVDLPLDVAIPNGIFAVGNRAFKGCSSVATFSLPETTTMIGEESFSACINVASIAVPRSVGSIGARAFAGCLKMATLTIPNLYGNDQGAGAGAALAGQPLGNGAFAECTSISRIVALSTTSAGAGGGAAAGGSADPGATSVMEDKTWVVRNSLVDALQAVGFTNHPFGVPLPAKWTVANCVELGYIAYIGTSRSEYKLVDGAFKGRMDLPAEITFPIEFTVATLTYIGANSFQGCTSVASLTMPETVTGIGSNAFQGCTSITTCPIPAGVIGIAASAFEGCSAMRCALTIPRGMTVICEATFRNCSSITDLTIPDGVGAIGVNAFAGCSSIRSLTLPRACRVNDGAFKDCTSITALRIPNGVVAIGNEAFAGCIRIARLVISCNVTAIGNLAFDRCTSLTHISVENDSAGGGLFGAATETLMENGAWRDGPQGRTADLVRTAFGVPLSPPPAAPSLFGNMFTGRRITVNLGASFKLDVSVAAFERMCTRDATRQFDPREMSLHDADSTAYGGGVARQWLLDLSKELLDPKTGLTVESQCERHQEEYEQADAGSAGAGAGAGSDAGAGAGGSMAAALGAFYNAAAESTNAAQQGGGGGGGAAAGAATAKAVVVDAIVAGSTVKVQGAFGPSQLNGLVGHVHQQRHHDEGEVHEARQQDSGVLCGRLHDRRQGTRGLQQTWHQKDLLVQQVHHRRKSQRPVQQARWWQQDSVQGGRLHHACSSTWRL